MREIKFRLWCKNKEEWESNDWILMPNGDIFDRENRIFMRKDNHVLMQYTGLKDKEGNDIYEGDIVEWEDGIGEVYFKDGQFVHQFREK